MEIIVYKYKHWIKCTSVQEGNNAFIIYHFSQTFFSFDMRRHPLLHIITCKLNIANISSSVPQVIRVTSA